MEKTFFSKSLNAFERLETGLLTCPNPASDSGAWLGWSVKGSSFWGLPRGGDIHQSQDPSTATRVEQVETQKPTKAFIAGVAPRDCVAQNHLLQSTARTRMEGFRDKSDASTLKHLEAALRSSFGFIG